MKITFEQLDLWEKESEIYSKESFEQYPDTGQGCTMLDSNYDIKQEYFQEGVYWILQKLRKLKEDGKTVLHTNN